MPLYIAPRDYKDDVVAHLKEKHPGRSWVEKPLSFSVAKDLVAKTCEDKGEIQPAVKLVSLFHEFIVSIWFGMDLHVYDGYRDLDQVTPEKIKFLFHGASRQDPWVLVELG